MRFGSCGRAVPAVCAVHAVWFDLFVWLVRSVRFESTGRAVGVVLPGVVLCCAAVRAVASRRVEVCVWYT